MIKYLDAFCVFFWACTLILISTITFLTFMLFGHSLYETNIFTVSIFFFINFIF